LKKSTISCQAGWDLVLFFRKAGRSDWRFPCAARDQGFGVTAQMTRKWRRKPLKALKTDSEIG
jgi:hypothetical protein